MIRARLERAGGELLEPAENSNVSWTERRGVRLTLEDSGGRTGEGEAAPLPGYSREDLETVVAQLRQASEALEAGEVEVTRGLGGYARFAWESAELGLSAAQAGGGVLTQLGGPGAASVGVQALVTAAPGPGWVTAAKTAAEMGFAGIKVKVGRVDAFDDECAGLHAMRSVLPDAVELRVDANRSLEDDAPSALARKLERLAVAGADLVEAPAPLELVEALSESPVPIALDESLRGPNVGPRAEALVRRGLVHVWVLKPGELGGVRATVHWMDRAEGCGAHVSLSHAFDGPISHRVTVALALARGAEGPHGLCPHPGLEALGGRAAWPMHQGRFRACDDPTPPQVPE